MEPRGLVISLKEGAFFDSGDDAVLKERYTSIGKLAKVVKSVPNPVRLRAIPIRGPFITGVSDPIGNCQLHGALLYSRSCVINSAFRSGRWRLLATPTLSQRTAMTRRKGVPEIAELT